MLFVCFPVLEALCFPPVSSRPLINNGDSPVTLRVWAGRGQHEVMGPGHKASCPGQAPPDQLIATEPGHREVEGYSWPSLKASAQEQASSGSSSMGSSPWLYR